MSEDLSDYLLEMGIRVRYLHSEVHTWSESSSCAISGMGVYDVLVGINLLREGLDLPEVSLVAILDADKEGFLRSDTALTQTIGRAARNLSGQVTCMPTDHPVDGASDRRQPMPAAPSRMPTTGRPAVDPQPLRKRIADITDLIAREDADTEALLGSGRAQSRGRPSCPG